MSHGRRFFREEPIEGEEFTLSEEEASHALKVLRIREGDRISVMDGKGLTIECVVSSISGRKVTAWRAGEVSAAVRPDLRPYLLLGLSEPSAVEEALLHATELGLWAFSLVETVRSPLKIGHLEKRKDRLLKIAVAGIKQSGNPFLPSIGFFGSLKEAVQAMPVKGFLFEQGAPPLSSLAKGVTGDVTLAVGPEGDFTEEEKRLLEEVGYLRASIAETTLRVETAALAALAQLRSLAAC